MEFAHLVILLVLLATVTNVGAVQGFIYKVDNVKFVHIDAQHVLVNLFVQSV